MYYISKEQFERLPTEMRYEVHDYNKKLKKEGKDMHMDDMDYADDDQMDEQEPAGDAEFADTYGKDKKDMSLDKGDMEYDDEEFEKASKMSEEDKNGIKDFDDASDKGMSLIVAMGKKPKKKKAM